MRRQVDDCERLIARKGWEVAERYVDDDVSAYNGRVRQAYRRMLHDLRDGYLNAVVVWDADRLHRQLARLSRVSVLEGQVGHAPALRERWPDLPLTRQHAIVAAVLDHLVVGPGRRGYNRFDASRLTPVWRI